MYHYEAGAGHPMELAGNMHEMGMYHEMGNVQALQRAPLNGTLPTRAPSPNGGCNCPEKDSMTGLLSNPNLVVLLAIALGLGMIIRGK